MTDPPVAERIAEIRAGFARALPARVANVETLWRTLKAGGGDAGTLAALQRAAHGLGGSGATFGFPAVSDAALAIDDILRPLVAAGGAPRPGDAARIDHHVARLVDAARDA